MNEGYSVWIMLTIIFAVIVLAKFIAKKTSSVDVLWLILGGVFLGNIGLISGHNELLEYTAELGVIFIMFALGFEEDLMRFIRGIKRSWGIAVFGAIFPFLAAFCTAWFYGYSIYSAVLWGLAMMATAVSLTMVTLRHKNLHKSQAATGIMTSAVVDDVLALMGLAFFLPMVFADASSSTEIGFVSIKIFIFFIITAFFALIIFPEKGVKEFESDISLQLKWLSRLNFYQYLSKISHYLHKIFHIEKLFLMHKGELVSLIVILYMFLMSGIADSFGFHAAVGAYFAGLFLREECFIFSHQKDEQSQIYIKQFFTQTKEYIDTLAFQVFGPVFFVILGTKLLLDLSILQHIFPAVLLLFFAVFVSQVLSAAWAAKHTGNYSSAESWLIGFGSVGRAELAFIVMDIAYTQHNIINLEQFYILMFTTFLLNMSVPLTIQWWIPYYQKEREEK